MAFHFAIRKLKRVLDKEQTLAAIGADRFAPGPYGGRLRERLRFLRGFIKTICYHYSKQLHPNKQ